jgi:signal transduction histidine kinase/integral membrane sensor domain MASE1/ActR/RegA family two-component response regulator
MHAATPGPQTRLTRTRPLAAAAGLLLLIGLYVLSGKLGLALALVNRSATAVWPPTGLALAALLVLGTRAWPAVFAGAFLVNLTTAGSIATSLAIAGGNTLEAVVGAALVRRWAGGQRAFGRAPDIFRFVPAAALATAISATVGTATLLLGGLAVSADGVRIWTTWWLGDLTGALLVAPLVLLWSAEPRAAWSPRRTVEAAALLLVIVAIAAVSFLGTFADLGIRNTPLTFLFLPPLVWAAFRFGPRETATAVALLSGLAVSGTLRGFGPFAALPGNEALLVLQCFMATLSVTSVTMAALVRERASAHERQRDLLRSAELAHGQLEAVVRHMPVGVMIAEAPSGRLLLANDQVERIWRHPARAANSVAGYGVYPGFHPDGRRYEGSEWPLARSLAAGEVVLSEEIEFERGDGTHGTMSVSSAPVHDPEGRIVAAVVIFLDVSDAKVVERAKADLLEMERSARTEAEAASRAKDEFLAMLGHELRNPLGAITSAVAVLERLPQPEERARPVLDVIARQSKHVSRLVDDLLDVARVTTGNIVLRREPVDLAETARRVAVTLEAGGRTEGHDLSLELERVWVDGDAARLEQVVTNLITNALRYTPRGGRIAVRVDRDERGARLEVSDTGIGIDPDVLPRVFDLFVQAAPQPDRALGGLGVGLSLVRRLVELHGGRVEAASGGRGRGSSFTVRLPALQRASLPAQPPRPTQTAARRRILVVEDHEDGSRMLQTMLELGGHEVHAAGSGPEAVETARRLRPDVAIVDIALPGFDGYEVARRLRASEECRDVLLVALTGYGRGEDRRRARAAGFDVHLAKPVDPERLIETLTARRDGAGG